MTTWRKRRWKTRRRRWHAWIVARMRRAVARLRKPIRLHSRWYSTQSRTKLLGRVILVCLLIAADLYTSFFHCLLNSLHPNTCIHSDCHSSVPRWWQPPNSSLLQYEHDHKHSQLHYSIVATTYYWHLWSPINPNERQGLLCLKTIVESYFTNNHSEGDTWSSQSIYTLVLILSPSFRILCDWVIWAKK